MLFQTSTTINTTWCTLEGYVDVFRLSREYFGIATAVQSANDLGLRGSVDEGLAMALPRHETFKRAVPDRLVSSLAPRQTRKTAFSVCLPIKLIDFDE